MAYNIDNWCDFVEERGFWPHLLSTAGYGLQTVGGALSAYDYYNRVKGWWRDRNPSPRPANITEGTVNPKPGSLSDVEARQWYLNQEAKIKSMIDTTKPLEQQARQAFNLRNQFRTQARELMSDRALAESLYKTDPNMTWQQVVERYSNRGLSGDSLWQEIINASTRSRASVNQGLGLQ